MSRSVGLGLVAVAVLWMMTGCTDEQSSGRADPADLDRVAAVLEDYVDAIARRDVDAANRLRCSDLRVDEDQLPLFATQVDQLLDRVGDLEVAEVRDGSDLAPIEGLVAYSFTGMDGELTTTLGNEDGRDVLCFWRPAASFEIEANLADGVVGLGGTDADAVDLLPDDVGDGFERVDRAVDVAGAPDEGHVSRTWQGSDSGGVTVSVSAHPDDATALAAAREIAEDAAPDSVEMLDLAAAPDAVAVRVPGYAWLFVQPPSVPPYVDRAVLPLGSLVITIDVSVTNHSNAVLEAVVADVLDRAHA